MKHGICLLSLQMRDFKMGDKFSPFLYDAVYVYAVAVNETINNGLNPQNGSHVVQYMRGKVLKGLYHFMYIPCKEHC